MDLSVVVVTWNAAAFIEDCLRSCVESCDSAGLEYELIVVDNASADNTVSLAEQSGTRVSVIRNAENRGFATANNQGASRATGRALLFLNPDTITDSAALGHLWRFLFGSERIGAVCPSLQYEDGAFQHSAFSFPTVASMALDVWSPHHRFTNGRINGRYPRSAYDHPFKIDYALGACFMVRREAFDRVGPWDEGFFLYYEEVDWFVRLRAAGYEAWCVPDAAVTHLEGRSTRRQRARSWETLQTSKLRFFRKHYPAWQAAAVKGTLLAGAALRRADAKRTHAAGQMSQSELAEWLAATHRVAAL
jgi:GT2 family glycosyltransferase